MNGFCLLHFLLQIYNLFSLLVKYSHTMYRFYKSKLLQNFLTSVKYPFLPNRISYGDYSRQATLYECARMYRSYIVSVYRSACEYACVVFRQVNLTKWGTLWCNIQTGLVKLKKILFHSSFMSQPLCARAFSFRTLPILFFFRSS